MEKLKRTRITVSTSELSLIRKLRGTAEADCPQCGARVEMATPEQAVTLTGIHSRAIYGLVERGQVHFIETAEGHLLICIGSLVATQHDLPPETQEIKSSCAPLLPPAEKDKPDRGYCRLPELYGAPEEKDVKRRRIDTELLSKQQKEGDR